MNLVTQTANSFTTLHLDEALHIPTMTFTLVSLQKFIDINVTPIFNIPPSKGVLKKYISDSTQHQIRLLSIGKGRLTLECTIVTHQLQRWGF